MLDRFSDGTGELAAELDAPHQTGGNPGYPARGMLRVNLLKFLLSERYANRFLDRLGNDPRLLELCELDRAPSERAFSDFKNHKLAPHQEELDCVLAAVFKECDDQIEVLKKLGVIPEDAPLLGEYLAVDATDIIAHASPRGQHCDPPGEGKLQEEAQALQRPGAGTVHPASPQALPRPRRRLGLPHPQIQKPQTQP